MKAAWFSKPLAKNGKTASLQTRMTFWGVAIGAVAVVLAATGSLKAIQTASVATAFPLMFLLLIVIYSTFKGLHEYQKAHGLDR